MAGEEKREEEELIRKAEGKEKDEAGVKGKGNRVMKTDRKKGRTWRKIVENTNKRKREEGAKMVKGMNEEEN